MYFQPCDDYFQCTHEKIGYHRAASQFITFLRSKCTLEVANRNMVGYVVESDLRLVNNHWF